MWGQSFTELFLRGGFVMWPMLAMSILAVAVILERSWVFWSHRTNFQQLVARLRPLVQQGKYDQALRLVASARDPVSRVAAAYLQHVRSSSDLRHEIAGREASQALVSVERRLNWLSTIGHLAPMLGLLGTVTGLITAFYQIELRAGQVQPADLAGGIWEALLTTVAGLVVALPTLALHHVLDQRVGATAMQMQWMIAYLDEWLGQAATSHDHSAASYTPTSPKAEQPSFGVTS